MISGKIKHPPTIANGRLSYASVSAINLVKGCEQIFYLNKVMGIKEPEGPWQKAGVKDHAARAWWLNTGQNRLPAHMLDTVRFPPKPKTPGLRVERGFDGRTDRERAFDPARTSVHISGVPFDGFIDAEWTEKNVGHVQDLKTTGNVQQNALREEDLATDVQMLVYGSKILGEHSHLEGVWLRHLYVQTKGAKFVTEVKKFLTKSEILTNLRAYVYPIVIRALWVATIPKGRAEMVPRTGVKTGYCHKYHKGCYYADKGCRRTEDEVFESIANAGLSQNKKPKRLLLGGSEDADYIDVQPKQEVIKKMAIADKSGLVRCGDCGKLLSKEGTPGKSYVHKSCPFGAQKVLPVDAAKPDETKKSAKAIAKAKAAEAVAKEAEAEEGTEEEEYSPIPPPKKKVVKAATPTEEEELDEEAEDEIDEEEEVDDEGDSEAAEETEEVGEDVDEDTEEESEETEEEDEEAEESEEVEEKEEQAPPKRPRGRPRKVEIVDSVGFTLYVDPKRVPKSAIDLTSWATKCAHALAAQYKISDIRIAMGDDHPLSFGRWRGRLAAMVKQASKPKGICVIYSNSDFSNIVMEELAAHATQVIHGA